MSINDVDSTRNMDELKSSSSILGRKIPDVEVLDSKLESALKKPLTTGFKRAIQRGRTKGTTGQSRFLKGTQIANDL